MDHKLLTAHRLRLLVHILVLLLHTILSMVEFHNKDLNPRGLSATRNHNIHPSKVTVAHQVTLQLNTATSNKWATEVRRVLVAMVVVVLHQTRNGLIKVSNNNTTTVTEVTNSNGSPQRASTSKLEKVDHV